ncbi:MAG: phosphodiester glycosidase family protein [Anaerolineae bacterium]|jgi:uncharacterized protein YigE (DUF2233 family)|nr:phosphodiester glycosidase family protein [Anaerolineae bacterium]
MNIRSLLITFGAFLLIGCNLNAAPIPPSPVPTWETLAPGLETRQYTVEDSLTKHLLITRIDPAVYRFRAHYADPLGLDEWREALSDAAVIINANFFDPQDNVLGLLVSDGVVHGFPYTDRGGTFTVFEDQVAIRSNVEQPYQGEQLDQAIQAFPMLILRGEATFFRTFADRLTRRSAIGIDQQGRVILVSTPLGGIRLTELSQWLDTSDLELSMAFNLDGGGSSMLWIGPSEYSIASFDPVPVVLAAYPKEMPDVP